MNQDGVIEQVHIQASYLATEGWEGARHLLVERSVALGLLTLTALFVAHRMSGECQSAVSICKYHLPPLWPFFHPGLG